ncbi:MAG TPA: hypothetical protein VJX67_06390 [Blastocatellia bacterium]|nr:hypothetical protein [Blastocatellia bacterium]
MNYRLEPAARRGETLSTVDKAQALAIARPERLVAGRVLGALNDTPQHGRRSPAVLGCSIHSTAVSSLLNLKPGEECAEQRLRQSDSVARLGEIGSGATARIRQSRASRRHFGAVARAWCVTRSSVTGLFVRECEVRISGEMYSRRQG